MAKNTTEPKVCLSGKCTLQVNTGGGTSKIEIPKVNPKTGENNADQFIAEVFHFAICRHGKDKVLSMLTEKFKNYGPEFQTQGIQ